MRKNDNRNWKVYPREYAKQIIEDIIPNHDMFITSTDIDEDTGKLIFYNNLHANWMDLYSIIFNIYPKTVFEVGCGSGQHLCNVQTILPNAIVYGCDINSEQMDFGKNVLKIDSDLYKNVQTLDFSLPTVPQSLGKTYDVVYSQSVLMHLSHDKTYSCLRNMLKISNKYVIFVENPADHDYNTILALLRDTEGYNIDVTHPSLFESSLCLVEKL